MIFTISNFEREFNNLLQRNIVIKLNDKILREGRLVLFTIKNFYLNFSISKDHSGKRLTHYELPIPFSYGVNGNRINLSYQLRYFHQEDSDIKFFMKLNKKVKLHKIYDKDITITLKD